MTFSFLQLIHLLGKLHDLCCFMIAHTYPFFVYQPISYQIRIKVTICQTDSFMTIKCELCKSGSSILSDRLIIKLSKIYSLCTYVDQMNRKQKFDVLLQRQFTIFSLMFFSLFSKFFTNILKIYDLPKKNYKIPKYSQTLDLTIMIYQAMSISQLRLAIELYLS